MSVTAELSPNLKWIARAGYASRAVVYFIIGGLAMFAALGWGGATTGSKGALLSLLDGGIGTALLLVVAFGLLCYATWRFFQSLTDADDHGTDLRGVVVRGGLLVSAITHTMLGLWALSVVVVGSEGDTSGGLSSWLMHQPYGRWLVGIAGLSIVGAGIAHIAKGLRRGFEKWIEAEEARMRFIRPISIIGLVTRGIVFLIVGGLFVYAAIRVDPRHAGGLSDALAWVRELPFGASLYLIVAAGLVCFGAYSLIEAIYRRIDAPGDISAIPKSIG